MFICLVGFGTDFIPNTMKKSPILFIRRFFYRASFLSTLTHFANNPPKYRTERKSWTYKKLFLKCEAKKLINYL